LENEALTVAIHGIFKDSFGSYGAPRIQDELLKRGYGASRPREARIVRANRLFAKRKRKFRVTTESKHDYPIAPNILDRDFTVHRKNQVWVSDMTYIRTGEGWMYLTVIMDLFHRKVVGWCIEEEQSSERAAFLMDEIAMSEGISPGCVRLHSDNGGPMKGASMLATLQSLGIMPSFSRPSVSNDNPFSESLFRTVKYRPGYPSGNHPPKAA